MEATAVGTPEDWRAAANIAVSLSEYLITVALAIIAGQAGLATVFVDKRSKLGPYYFASFVALVALVASIMYGGRAIADVYKPGFDGQWKYSAVAARKFGLQATILLLGFIVAIISVALALMIGKPIAATASESGPAATQKPKATAMSQKTYLMTVSLIFLVIAFLHLLRVIFGWGATIGGWAVPTWISWLAIVVAAYLAYEGFRLSK